MVSSYIYQNTNTKWSYIDIFYVGVSVNKSIDMFSKQFGLKIFKIHVKKET